MAVVSDPKPCTSVLKSSRLMTGPISLLSGESGRNYIKLEDMQWLL